MLQFLRKNNDVPYKTKKEFSYFIRLLRQINELEAWVRELDATQFPVQTQLLKEDFATHKNLDLLIPRAFALTREAAHRVLGERMFDVQLMGGIVLHQGRIAEMKTGEGKTLTSTTAAFLNSLSGNSVHMVTVNDYLAKRDAEWMQPVYEYLGQSVGYIISNMPNDLRQEMYTKNIVYATNNELGFDYLRDNLRIDRESVCKGNYGYCIVDEIDSVLIDEARTPLIISGQAQDNTQKYKHSNGIVSYLTPCTKDARTGTYPDDEKQLDGDYKMEEKSKNVSFTKQGLNKIEALLTQKSIIQGSIEDIENFEYVHYATQSLRAHKLFVKDVDYIISDEGKVEIIDEFTGRVLTGRRYSDGLHQAIEAKEKIRIERQNKTLASITFQNFFRMYGKLSGMTGTAVTEEKEFTKIYGLDVVEVPTHNPIIRIDSDDLIYINEEDKVNAIVAEVMEVHKQGQPVLLGTASIESSEKLSHIFKKRGIPHNVLNAKNHLLESKIIAEAGKKNAVTIATNMAGRGTDIKLGGNLDFKIAARITEEDSEESRIIIREEEIKKWKSSFQEVVKLGGLYVLGTERHESRRIDNQLRGRSGRQGDAGCSKFFLSLDDQLLRLFGQGLDRLRGLMSRALVENEPLSHPLISKTMERAQKNVEARNFEIRKHLLDFDDVLNNQKTVIYTQREEILNSDNLVSRLYSNINDMLLQISQNVNKDEQLQEAIEFVKTTLHFSKNTSHISKLEELLEYIHEDLRYKSSLVGDKTFTEIIRMEYLRIIDMNWQDHISSLEETRQAVYLRSYAQKNPLLEYKLESFKMFEDMVESISLGILRKFVGLKAENIHSPNSPMPYANTFHTQHKQVSMFEGNVANSNTMGAMGSTTGRAMPPPPAPGGMQVVSNDKVGRNDPCPCGSNKKYKHCHGRST